MRAEAVEAFEYRSARCRQAGINVALFAPQALADKRPSNLTAWFCETTAAYVAFKNPHSADAPQLFKLDEFQQDGRLPLPA